MPTATLRNAKYYRDMRMDKTFKYGKPVSVSIAEAEALATLRTVVKNVPKLLFDVDMSDVEQRDHTAEAADPAHEFNEGPQGADPVGADDRDTTGFTELPIAEEAR